MKTQILSLLMVIALGAGCSDMRHSARGGAGTEAGVLAGGPTSGTTIDDLPQAVRDTLKQKVPHAQIADIDRQNRDGQVVYKISFSAPGKNPTLYIAEDGAMVPHPVTP